MQRFLKSRNFLMALLLSAVSTTAFGQIGSAITTTLAAPWMKMSISAAFVIWAIFTLVKNWESILGGVCGQTGQATIQNNGQQQLKGREGHMKISKAVFAIIAGAAISRAAHGHEAVTRTHSREMAGQGEAHGHEAVTAEKQAAIKKILPDAYGSVEVRHSTLRVMEKDEQVADSPVLSVRPTLGTTLFDGSVDTSFTFRYNKKADTSRIGKSSTYNSTTIDIVGNDIANLKAYSLTYVAGEDSFSTSDLGFIGEAAKAVGPVKFSSYLNPTVSFNLTLTEADTKVEKEHPGIWNATGVSAKYTIGATGLAVGTGLDFGQNWEEKLAIVQVEDGTTRRSSDGYKYRSSTLIKLNTSYKLSDKTSIVAQVRGVTEGFFAESINKSNEDEVLGYGPTRYEARLSLNATLF